jgi:hypothetical protein
MLICGANSESVYATTNEEPRPLEETYPEVGYKTVEEAVKEFEQHFNQNLKLPLRIPPISFTHHFGRFNDLDGDINDSFELIFINDKSPKNQYEIEVRPLEHKIPIKDKRFVELFTLKNGNEAKFINISESFEALVFERDNWQYRLSINKRISDKVTPEVLVEIANSIDFPSEKKNPLE